MSESASSLSPSPSAESEEAPAFDIAAKLTQRLASHTSERNHQKHLIDTYTLQLSNLTKSTPKKPRDSKQTLQNRIKKLERDRTARSLSLQREKALLREISSAEKQLRLHSQCESHQELIWRKRGEIESAKEALRSTDSSIAEIEKVLSTVKLAKRLGCTTAELVSREVSCSVEKMNGILLDIASLLSTAEERGVNITVDRIHGKFVIKGNEASVKNAMMEIEESANKIDVEVKLSEEQTVYLQQSSVLAELKGKNEGVRFDFLARVHRMVLTGGPSKVAKAKSSIDNMDVVSKTYSGLDGKQSSIVVGKHGATIHELSTKHGVVMNLSKEGGDTSSLKIIGPTSKVDAALSEVTTLLFDNEQLKESFDIDKIMKNELIQNLGASIKEFENSVANAVDAPAFLTIERNAPRDVAPTLILKCPRSVMDRAKSLVTKKIREFESNIVTVAVSPEIIPAIIGKGGTKIESLQQLGGGAAVEADKSGFVKIYSHDADSRQAVQDAVQQIIDENQIGHVEIEKKSLGFLFGEAGKETMTAVNELNCNVQTNDDESKLTIKGTKENIAQASELLKEFMDKNYVLEMDIHADDENLLFTGGEKSLLHTVEEKHDVKAVFRKDRGVLQIRGEMEKAEATKKEVEEFLYGGEGIAVIKFKVPEDAIGSIVGKGE